MAMNTDALTSALLAYDEVMGEAKSEGRSPSTADKFRAMKAAIEAYEADKANVLPPTRGTDSQQEACDALLLACRKAVVALAHAAQKSEMYDEAYEGLANAINAEAERRFRAQGGNTSDEKDSDA